MNGWVLWILASAVFLALYDIAKKASVRDNEVLPVLLCSTCFGCLAYLVGITALGRLGATLAAVDARVILLGLLKSAIVAASWVFTFCALRTLPVTIATPIRSSAPALVFLVALVLYGEIPTWIQGVGMLLVFAGYCTFSWAGRHEGIDFFHSKAVGLAVVGAVLSAVSSIWDKYVFQVAASPVEATQLVFQVGLVAVYGVSLLVRRCFLPSPSTGSFAFTWRWTIPFVGVLLFFSDWFVFTGLAVALTPMSFCSLMRRFSVAITFVLGALFFHETNLARKSVALALVLAGIALLCR